MKVYTLIVVKIFLLLSFLYVSLCLFLFFNQESLIFFPSKYIGSIPNESNIQEVSFKTKDNITLNGWFIDNKSKKTIIFFHGNGGNISSNKERIKIFNDLGVNGLLFDYRGYGKSEGSIVREKDIYVDGEAAYQYILSRGVKPEEIIIWGQSLGGAIAIHTAQSKNIFRTIIESTFISMDSMASEVYWFIPSRLILVFHFDNIGKISNIISPMLIIHSPDDEVISIENGKALFQKFEGKKEFLETRGSHNGGFGQSYSLYKSHLQQFLEIP